MNISEIVAEELNVLGCGAWGTIGPHSVTAAAKAADAVGAKFGLLCHSEDAAYEAALRSFEPAYGDVIITPAYSTPSNSLVAVCTGAAPVFCDIGNNGMITAETLEAALLKCINLHVICVVADIVGDGAGLDKVSELCKKHKLPFILRADGMFSARINGKAPAAYADAVIYSLGSGSEVYIGTGGLVATDSEDVYAGAFAYHNCGRSPGEGATLNFDAITGGDLRITEWSAAIADIKLEKGEHDAVRVTGFKLMHRQPVFRSDYFRKVTGYNGIYSDDGLEMSLKAEKKFFDN